jgi:hypothetical protein
VESAGRPDGARRQSEDSFVSVAVTDRPRESTAARIAELFGTGQRRAIVD